MFEHRDGMLRNILTRAVPALAADHAQRVLGTVLERAGLQPGDIGTWVLHAGGRDVLQALEARLELQPGDLRYSAAMLREYGNLSSAFVYFVLEAALDDAAPPAGGGCPPSGRASAATVHCWRCSDDAPARRRRDAGSPGAGRSRGQAVATRPRARASRHGHTRDRVSRLAGPGVAASAPARRCGSWNSAPATAACCWASLGRWLPAGRRCS